jgi:hypothetical protein
LNHLVLLLDYLIKNVRWVGHVALMGERRVHTRFWCGELEERDCLEEWGLLGRVTLKLGLRGKE